MVVKTINVVNFSAFYSFKVAPKFDIKSLNNVNVAPLNNPQNPPALKRMRNILTVLIRPDYYKIVSP